MCVDIHVDDIHVDDSHVVDIHDIHVEKFVLTADIIVKAVRNFRVEEDIMMTSAAVWDEKRSGVEWRGRDMRGEGGI